MQIVVEVTQEDIDEGYAVGVQPAPLRAPYGGWAISTRP